MPTTVKCLSAFSAVGFSSSKHSSVNPSERCGSQWGQSAAECGVRDVRVNTAQTNLESDRNSFVYWTSCLSRDWFRAGKIRVLMTSIGHTW